MKVVTALLVAPVVGSWINGNSSELSEGQDQYELSENYSDYFGSYRLDFSYGWEPTLTSTTSTTSTTTTTTSTTSTTEYIEKTAISTRVVKLRIRAYPRKSEHCKKWKFLANLKIEKNGNFDFC